MRRVLVPLDGTDHATTILPDAERLAGPGGTIILVRDANRPRYNPMTREYGQEVAVEEARETVETVAEKLRGKRIPFEVMERAGVVGFVLILMIFVIGLSNDISTLYGPGIGLR